MWERSFWCCNVFKSVIPNNAVSMIVAYQHPCDNITLSIKDINVTKRLVEVAKLLEIEMFDHSVLFR